MIRLLLCFTFSLSTVWAETPKVVFLGDSLTAGYGIERKDSWPSLIENKLKLKGKEIKAIYGGISGSTTASGLRRLRWYLKSKPDILVLALGANDGLRGLDLDASKKNLEHTIKLALENKLKVFLAEMRVPPNYSKEYAQKFQKMYKDLSESYPITLIPFFLKDVAGKKDLNLSDGIHPNEKGNKVIADHIYPYLEKAL